APAPPDPPPPGGAPPGPGVWGGAGDPGGGPAARVAIPRAGAGDAQGAHHGEAGPRVQFTLFADAVAGAYHLDLD
ncbi:hypothetical protein ACFXA3_31445, partial [Streptomyces sp. NPDC059456]|uniref:hypothetical protein n=1 Tax=Streptomyces sp. NPDC059456 TaxID=3346838 RepID=UPI0036833CE9